MRSSLCIVSGSMRSCWASFRFAIAITSRSCTPRAHPPPPLWSHADFSHPDQPVAAVSWFEAVKYCEWLREISGKHYRLPSEAEWERAARAGREAELYTWGNEASHGERGVYAAMGRGSEGHAAGRRRAQSMGLLRARRKCPRVVRGLVSKRLLRGRAGKEPPRARHRREAGVAGRFVAASC